MIDLEMVEDTGNDKVDEIEHAMDSVVPAWCGGHDDSTLRRQSMHVVELEGGEGCFAGNDDEFPPFFEVDLSRALNEILASSVDDAGEGASRARADDHGLRAIGTACDRGHVVFGVMLLNKLTDLRPGRESDLPTLVGSHIPGLVGQIVASKGLGNGTVGKIEEQLLFNDEASGIARDEVDGTVS